MVRIEASTHHICVACGRQFIQDYATPQGYWEQVKTLCLRMYVNGSGFRAIERVTGVHHTTVIYWVKQVGQNLPDAYAPDQPPQVGERGCTRNLCRLKKKRF